MNSSDDQDRVLDEEEMALIGDESQFLLSQLPSREKKLSGLAPYICCILYKRSLFSRKLRLYLH